MTFLKSIALWAALSSTTALALDPGSYAPKTNQPCPATLVRETPSRNQTIAPQELEYLNERRKKFPSAWRDWVGDGKDLGYDLEAMGVTGGDGSGLPNIAISVSGGGYRASQYGAGALSALDIRNETAKDKGTGGLFQVASYLSGLSGGSWTISSWLFNNFPDMYDMVLGDTHKGGKLNSWFLHKDLFRPGGFLPFDDDNEDFFGSILWGVDTKAFTGLDTSLTDIWARALAYHFLSGLAWDGQEGTITTEENFFTNDTSHGAGILWSDMGKIPVFRDHDYPVPLVIANVRPPGFGQLPPNTTLFLNSTVYEFSPWEMGSYDPDLSAFMDVKYLGTHVRDGKPDNDTACVTNFDQTSFVFGTSSSLFNQIFYGAKDRIDKFDDDSSSVLLLLLRRMLSKVSTRADDVANYPNPFEGINRGIFQDAETTWIELIDGATNKENVPLAPLFVKARAVDTIVAIDGSADDENDWPLAESIYASRNRTQEVTPDVVQLFPPMPEDLSDIGRLGLSRRPTWFGCDPEQNPPEYPLVLYFPNSPPVDGSAPVTNSATFKLQYTKEHTQKFLDQAQGATMNGFMPGKAGPDESFGQCLQCAALDRSRYKQTPVTTRSDFCSSCFKKYCYDPENPPPEGQIVGRNFVHSDDDPFFIKDTLKRNLWKIIVGSVMGLLALVGCIVGGCWLVKRQKRTDEKKRASRAAYARLSRGEEGSEWSVRHSYEMSKSTHYGDGGDGEGSGGDHSRLPSAHYSDGYETAKEGHSREGTDATKYNP